MLALHESTTSWLKQFLRVHLALEDGEVLRVEDRHGKPVEGVLTEEHEAVYVTKVRVSRAPPNRCTVA